ncbi:unnamed protein product [Candida parapsilosis]
MIKAIFGFTTKNGDVSGVYAKKLKRRRKEYAKFEKQKKMVPSRIESSILALLAPRLNQSGQGTN